MPFFDPTKIEDKEELIPENVYQVKVVSVGQKYTQDNVEMWNMKMTVADGKHRGFTLWDNIVWSVKLASRTKSVLAAFGMDVSRPHDFKTEDLLNRTANAHVIQEAYQGKIRNKVEFFGGYAPAIAGVVDDKPVIDDSEIPF